ncbi:MAG TPA: GDP-mannose 4,6-dehydratase, partial [Gemmatimonadales bacterium]|nr:GDP-mannose 4,6-dehydratase [Gemmatimonadales bacterium]
FRVHVRVLVTGADGFVGRHLVARLVEDGHQVTAACRAGARLQGWPAAELGTAVQVVPFELDDSATIRAAVVLRHDAVIHLAGVASVREAREDPGRAWVINAAGTARLLDAVLSIYEAGNTGSRILVVSSAEVYGNGPATPRVESDPARPQSAYAASKVGAEVAALEAWRRTGLHIMIARPFTHTGPGQRPPYVVPSFVERLLAVRSQPQARIPTGNLEPMRDLLDVRDVVAAYVMLLRSGAPGETYNVARGEAISLRDVFHRLAALVGVRAEPVPEPSLVRAEDIPYLVGDPGKLQRATGWSATIPLDQTLRDMVDAQTH